MNEYPRVLITGVTGFVGLHLARYLAKTREYELHGLIRWRSRIEAVNTLSSLGVTLHEGDITDLISLEKVIQIIRPNIIFHLAAQSFVPASWEAPVETLETNVIGQLNLFEVCRRSTINPIIQIACSSEEYGYVKPTECPIKESNPLRPLSPYGVSKVSQDYLGYQYFKSYGLRVIRTRAFNHTGPGRGEQFVTSNFAKQIAEIEEGLREPVIMTGNLDAMRDFTDVRDMVEAYTLAVEKGEPGEVYNIASGTGYRIALIVDILQDLSKIPFEYEYDPSRGRPSDVPLLLGDASKFKTLTGWEPKIPFKKTVEDLLNWWRGKV